MKALRLFYRSKVLLSFAAAALALQSQSILKLRFDEAPVVALCLGTLSYYRLHFWYHQVIPGKNMKLWPFQMPIGLIVLLFTTAVCVGVVIAYYFTGFQTSMFVMGSLLSAAYTFPLFPLFAGRQWKLHPWQKIFVLSLMWTWLTILPIIPQFHQVVPALPLLAGRFFFMFAICIPFDVRDTAADRETMQYTLADRYGLTKLRYWIWMAILVSIIFHTWCFALFNNHWLALFVLAGHGIFTAGLAAKAFGKPRGHDVYLWIDMQLIVLPVLMALLQIASSNS